MTEQEYKAEWQAGLHKTEYNNCRFAENKLTYCKNWIANNCINQHGDYANFISENICSQKIKIATDAAYKQICSDWSDKTKVINELLPAENMQALCLPTYCAEYGILTKDKLLSIDQSKPYIVKCNHGSGWNKIKTANTTIDSIVQEINVWQTLNYAYIAGYEAQYERIMPGYVIQPMLCDKPIDYGFWYIHGELQAVSLTKKYGKNLEEYIAFVTPDCKASTWYIGMKPEMHDLSTKFAYAVYLMREYTDKLAKPFDFVRVDMMYVDSKPYFEELTFTPCAGKIAVTFT